MNLNKGKQQAGASWRMEMAPKLFKITEKKKNKKKINKGQEGQKTEVKSVGVSFY